ncbi:hypothetical protein GQ55_8G182400 [Panicum hallii var. hallii]|uniref:Uncharacterized protein n=1 Tax=Panicum hallii var. hallii TaxID=1504633 RepID=A0A2T7CNP2_9POAL|nr:hypothetical protein GQ55_8G182400 [Panicum hallii var. hallii]
MAPGRVGSGGSGGGARGEADAQLEEATAERAWSPTLLRVKEAERARGSSSGRRVEWQRHVRHCREQYRLGVATAGTGLRRRQRGAATARVSVRGAAVAGDFFIFLFDLYGRVVA